ncbi:MAG: methenyltetrahydromethanopterin cyclohydrolase [Candidatus Bathyarchaeia archaeon]|nr:methenyltetrahydromethanopterin cyclohydrolase [Candidatus Bathyarchaeia archaeon]
MDPNLFAPAVLIVNNVKTGRIFRAGEIGVETLAKSLGL